MPGAFAAHPILRIRSPIIGRGEQVFELTGAPVTIGRAEDCDVVLLEQSASRVHARLLPEAGGWTLVDEESHAGVFVGGQRVRRHTLVDGDRFRIGETDFQLVARPASQPTLVGTTRAPTGETPIAIPSIASAPTIASGLFGDEELRRVPDPASLSVPPIEEPRPAPPPVAVAPPVIAPPRPMAPPPRPAPPPPPIVAPPFDPPVAAAPPVAVVRPPAPPASAPSFVDFGPVGRPGAEPADSQSFSGRLADDPSRMGEIESRVSSRFGTWILVVLLFLGLSLLVLSLAYDVTWSDVMSAFE